MITWIGVVALPSVICLLLWLFFVFGLTLPLLSWMTHHVGAFVQGRDGAFRAHMNGFRFGGLWHGLALFVKRRTKSSQPCTPRDSGLRLRALLSCLLPLLALSTIPFGEPFYLGRVVLPLQGISWKLGALFALFVLWARFHVIIWGTNTIAATERRSLWRLSEQYMLFAVIAGLGAASIFIAFGTLDFLTIVQAQGSRPWTWGVVISPVGALLCFAALLACGFHAPFDGLRCDPSCAPFVRDHWPVSHLAVVDIGRDLWLIAGVCVFVTLFLGGWHLPFLSTSLIVGHATVWLATYMVLAGALFLFIAATLVHRVLKPFVVWGDQRDRAAKFWLPPTLCAGLGMLWIGLGVIPLVQWFWLYPLTTLLLHCSAFALKVWFCCFVVVLLRWSVPRVAVHVLMRWGWQILLPSAALNLVFVWFWSSFWIGLWRV